MLAVASYRLETVIGSGATGTVWRAVAPDRMRRWVALKRVRAGNELAAVQLRHEAAVLAALDHPHVVALIDVVDDPHVDVQNSDPENRPSGVGLALVMPLAVGGSLRDLLDRRCRLTPGEVVAVLAPVADAVDSAHRRGVLHGDLKPANVLFTADGEPLVADFGAARLLPCGPATARGLTAAEFSVDAPIVGSPAYLAPEVLAGAEPDRRADVYAIGVVAYHALAGHLPYGGDQDADIAADARAENRPPLAEVPGVPPKLAAVVDAALAADPASRPDDCAWLAAALRQSVDAVAIRLPEVEVDAALAQPGDHIHALDVDAPPAHVPPSERTHVFGPRPPRPVVSTPHRRAWVPVCAVAAAVAALAAIGWGATRIHRGGPIRAAASSPSRTAPQTSLSASHPASTCAPEAPPPAPPGSQTLRADVSGDGCSTPVVWAHDVVTPEGRVANVLYLRLQASAAVSAYTLGIPGDVLLFGRWRCTAAATPALYRPTTGEVFYFDRLADRTDVVADGPHHSGKRQGRPYVVHSADHCDEVRVATGR